MNSIGLNTRLRVHYLSKTNERHVEYLVQRISDKNIYLSPIYKKKLNEDLVNIPPDSVDEYDEDIDGPNFIVGYERLCEIFPEQLDISVRRTYEFNKRLSKYQLLKCLMGY